jgi:hypothetical protein
MTMAGPGKAGMGRGCPVGRGFSQMGCPCSFTHKAEDLGLSEKQVEDLKALKRDLEKSMIEKRAAIDMARVDLEELKDQKKIDFGKIKAKISRIADMEKEIRLEGISVIEKSHRLLSAEQLEKAKTLCKKGGHCKGEGSREVIKEIIIEETIE